MKEKLKFIRHGFLGFAQGGLISIMPLPINLGLVLLFLIRWPISIVRSSLPIDRIGQLIKMGVGILTVVAAIYLPVKHLDGRVGPMHYERMSLYDLYQRLYTDWNIHFTAYDPSATNTFVTFGTDRRMSRRKVLQQLAETTDSDLRIAYCGNSATFLFGGALSCLELRPRKAQPTSPGDVAARAAPEK